MGAVTLAKFRSLASLLTICKILRYIWLRMLPKLTFTSFQTGFVAGAHAADAVDAVSRAVELCLEWGQEFYVAQLDLTMAFDEMHSAVNALRMQRATHQCVAVFAAMTQSTSLAFRLDNVISKSFNFQRGLRQGAPESPLVFAMVGEYVLGPVLECWQKRGSSCYADAWALR